MDRRCFVLGLIATICTSSMVYATNETNDSASQLFPEQILSANTVTDSDVVQDTVTGAGASGEAQTAEMDQNGRWHIKDKPPGPPPKPTSGASGPLPPVVHEAVPPGASPTSSVPKKETGPGLIPAPPAGQSGQTAVQMAPKPR